MLTPGNPPGPIGEQTAAQHSDPAGIALIPGESCDDHTPGTQSAKGISHFNEIIAVALFTIGHSCEKSGFRQIGKQVIAPAAQFGHGFHMGFRHPGIELSVVTHHRINDFQTIEFVKDTADSFSLPGVGQITGGNGIKAAANGCHMLGEGGNIFRHRLYNGCGKSRVGGQYCRGQHTGADTHGRENRQGNSQTAFAHAGKILKIGFRAL